MSTDFEGTGSTGPTKNLTVHATFSLSRKKKKFLVDDKTIRRVFLSFFLVSFLDTFLKGGNFLFNVYQTDFVTDSGNGERGIFKIIN